jgi:beta-N-acetylhexosaminidase
VQFVMMSLAVYPRVDPQPAAFSSTIIRSILREGLGFDGVVISDDVGLAAAVQDRTPAQRALDFFRAGGDMLLTVLPADIQPMTNAVFTFYTTDAAFKATIDAAVQRVLRAKAKSGLLPKRC